MTHLPSRLSPPQPLPLGAVAMIGLGAAMLTNTLTFAQSFAAFGTEIPWCARAARAASRRCAALGVSLR